MDLDSAKENIMPLAGGRNARCLEAALSSENHHEILVELQKQRLKYEKAIHEYEGDDPLEPWFDYIQWIEQSYPSGGKENGLFDVLLKCLTTFESNEKYFQDRRMIKLYIKYIDTQTLPQEFYQELYNQGIGTMVADLYICWAYYYDLCGNFGKADEIFRKGLDCRAQPLDELEQAHKHFGFTMSQRILYKDEESSLQFMSSMQERRHALTSLRAHGKKVGSIRTGAAVKSHQPGKLEVSSKNSSHASNVAVKVFEDQNCDPNVFEPSTSALTNPVEPPTPQSVVRSIIDSTRKQENMREPGPWSKARLKDKKKGDLFGAGSHHHDLGFDIMEDEITEFRAPLPKGEDNYSKGIQLPAGFVRRNEPQSKWDVPLSFETDPVGPNVYPCYEKSQLYPKPNEVYCPEEYAGWKWFKNRGQTNDFVRKHNQVWCADFDYGFHYYPNFCRKNIEQTEFPTKRFIQDEEIRSDQVFTFLVNEVYPDGSTEEFQFEEILRKQIRAGKRKLKLNTEETIFLQEDLEETQCAAGAVARRSMFPTRKSIVPKIRSIPETSFESMPPPRLSVIASSPQVSSPSEEVARSLMQCSSSERKSVLSKSEDELRRNLMCKPSTSSELFTGIRVEKKSGPQFDEKSQSADKDEITVVRAEKFTIFEDDEIKPSEPVPVFPKSDQNQCPDTIVSPVGGDTLFKAPQILPRPAWTKPGVSVNPGQENDDEKALGFAANESCSTQTFNFFIKSQSVSTPKNVRKSQSYLSQVQELPPQSVVVSPPTPPIDAETPLGTTNNTLFPPKQLSTIMEMTETNTGSSGTKSSTETHDFDSEISKSHFTTRPVTSEQMPALDPIPEVSTQIMYTSGAVQASESRREISHVVGAEALPPLMTSMPPLMTSMKVFEDKTDTVPRMLLVRPQQLPKADDDNFDVLFTTTPPRTQPTKINQTTMNESLTFSKLSEITLPKLVDIAKSNFQLRCNEQGNAKEPKKPFLETDMGTTEFKMPESFAVNDSMTFSKLKDFTFPNYAAGSQNKEAEVVEQRSKIFSDKSLLQEFEKSVMIKDEMIGDPAHMRLDACSSRHNFEMPDYRDARTLAKIDRPISIQNDPAKLETNTARDSSHFNVPVPRVSHIQEMSLHIKEEPENTSYKVKSSCGKTILNRFSEISHRQSKTAGVSCAASNSPERKDIFSPPNPSAVSMKDQSIIWLQGSHPIPIKEEPGAYGGEPRHDPLELGRSIYIKPSPKTPKNLALDWADDGDVHEGNDFVHVDVDLDRTRQVIEDIDQNVNPFEPLLIQAFLDRVEICSYIEKLPNCKMANKLKSLHRGGTVCVADKTFDVIKAVAQGGFGSIFCAKERSSGKLYAIKQENPANLWEYYICLELKSRIDNANIMHSFMDIEYAVIGNNASFLITEFSQFGSLINVCHKVYAATRKNTDEFVVMVLASQLLSIIDHLHACNIIHADIKPDNFLLMSKLSYPFTVPSIQLIDFGQSIDLLLFPPKQTFNYVSNTEGFTCIEMLENRPWTYQADLFGLAGTIHVLLFGKYMDVEKRAATWYIKSHMPRYFHKTLWNTIFTTLLNVRDCNSMPNLQNLRRLLEEEIVEKERIVKDKISEFNKAISQ